MYTQTRFLHILMTKVAPAATTSPTMGSNAHLHYIIQQVEHFYGAGWNTTLWEMGLLFAAVTVVFGVLAPVGLLLITKWSVAGDLRKIEGQLEIAKTENTTTRTQLEEAKAENAKTQKGLEEARAETAGTLKELREARADNATTRKDLEKAMAEIATTRKDLERGLAGAVHHANGMLAFAQSTDTRHDDWYRYNLMVEAAREFGEGRIGPQLEVAKTMANEWLKRLKGPPESFRRGEIEDGINRCELLASQLRNDQPPDTACAGLLENMINTYRHRFPKPANVSQKP